MFIFKQKKDHSDDGDVAPSPGLCGGLERVMAVSRRHRSEAAACLTDLRGKDATDAIQALSDGVRARSRPATRHGPQGESPARARPGVGPAPAWARPGPGTVPARARPGPGPSRRAPGPDRTRTCPVRPRPGPDDERAHSRAGSRAPSRAASRRDLKEAADDRDLEEDEEEEDFKNNKLFL